MRSQLLRLVAGAALLAGCGGDDGTAQRSTPTSTSVSSGSVHFLSVDDATWTLREAVRPLALHGALRQVEPTLDWWSEHERNLPVNDGVEGQDLRLSGHHTALEDHVQDLALDGESARVGDRRGIVAVGPDGTPATVSVEVTPDYTVMVLSYALGKDDLTDIAERLTEVTLDEWIAKGGEVVPCAPPSTECMTSTT